MIAKAWTDPEYKKRLLANGSAAIAELGFAGLQGEDMVVLENTPKVHNVIVWDSIAELRYLVPPERPARTENMTEDQLAAIVTQDSMVGVTKASARRTGSTFQHAPTCEHRVCLDVESQTETQQNLQ